MFWLHACKKKLREEEPAHAKKQTNRQVIGRAMALPITCLFFLFFFGGGGDSTLQKQNGCFNPVRGISVAASESILSHMLTGIHIASVALDSYKQLATHGAYVISVASSLRNNVHKQADQLHCLTSRSPISDRKVNNSKSPITDQGIIKMFEVQQYL